MSRLKRELKPYLSTLRLSRTRLVVFIEGTDFDPLFYGAVLLRFGRESGEPYEIRRASELPSNALPGMGGSGGQYTLLGAAAFWERYKAKYAHRWKHEKALAFCIDKDSGDMTGLPKFNAEVIRTPLHSAENHLFASANIEKALEIGLSLAPNEAADLLQMQVSDWCQSAAMLWRDWVVFCLLCLRLEVPGFSTYKSPSIFNNPSRNPVDQTTANAHFTRLQVASGLDVASFELLRNDLGGFIDELLAAKKHDLFFKGKWYFDILFSQLEASRRAQEARACGKRGLSIAIRSQFQLRVEDYAYYEESFRHLIAQLPAPIHDMTGHVAYI